MFTKQYEDLIVLAIVGAKSGTKTIYDYKGSSSTINGSAISPDYLKIRPLAYNFTLGLGNSSAGHITFWNGASAPSKDAIVPDGTEIKTSLFTSSVAISGAVDENGTEVTRLYTLTNASSEAFTIDTVCLCAEFQWAYGKNGVILCDKTQLESPLTIEPGGIGQVTYTLRYEWPTT